MRHIVRLMKESIKKGLQGADYQDRILPVQSLGFKDKMEDKSLLNGGMLNTIILYVTAMMEMKSSMGIIVAAPTAGSCGALPGTLIGATDIMQKSEEELIKAMLAAGMIGVFYIRTFYVCGGGWWLPGGMWSRVIDGSCRFSDFGGRIAGAMYCGGFHCPSKLFWG